MLELTNILINLGILVVAAIGVFVAYQQGQKAERARRYHAEGSEWVDERLYTYERLLQELVGLDYASVAGLDQESEGLPSQWAPLFEKSPSTWRVIIDREGQIVAYWSFFFLTEEVVTQLKLGKLREGTLRLADIVLPNEPLEAPILVSMVTIHPAFSGNNEIRYHLYQSMVDAIDDLLARGVKISDIYANAFSRHGRNIATKLGLQQVETDKGTPLLTVVWSEELRSRLIRQAARAKAQI